MSQEKENYTQLTRIIIKSRLEAILGAVPSLTTDGDGSYTPDSQFYKLGDDYGGLYPTEFQQIFIDFNLPWRFLAIPKKDVMLWGHYSTDIMCVLPQTTDVDELWEGSDAHTTDYPYALLIVTISQQEKWLKFFGTSQKESERGLSSAGLSMIRPGSETSRQNNALKN